MGYPFTKKNRLSYTESRMINNKAHKLDAYYSFVVNKIRRICKKYTIVYCHAKFPYTYIVDSTILNAATIGFEKSYIHGEYIGTVIYHDIDAYRQLYSPDKDIPDSACLYHYSQSLAKRVAAIISASKYIGRVDNISIYSPYKSKLIKSRYPYLYNNKTLYLIRSY